MGNLIEYECPYCGGRVEFDSVTQKMKCPFCDSSFEIDELDYLEEEEDLKNAEAGVEETPSAVEKPEESMEWNIEAGNAWSSAEQEGVKVYVCKSCGGEIVGDATMASTKCPYCDNPIVMSGNLAGDLKPDYIIPFKLDKVAAKSAFEKHLLGKTLIPKEFKDKRKIEEIKGVYVPFWLFDTELEAYIDYEATIIEKWSDDQYDYTRTKYFAVERGGSLAFDRIPVDGSSKMPNDLMESLEPFDFKDAVPFKTAYLAGYVTDRYDVDVEDSIEDINRRVRRSAEEMFQTTVQRYHYTEQVNSSIQLKNNSVKYALYPVWLLNITWDNKKYTFAMNGQTGKFVGNLPIDKKSKKALFRKWFMILGAVSAIVSALIAFL